MIIVYERKEINILNLINQFCESHKEQDKWENSSFYCIKKLTNDARGELGENLISKVFHFYVILFNKIILTIPFTPTAIMI